ncbi:MAG: chemotaxis protein CheC [Dehalococcoidales bacterium]
MSQLQTFTKDEIAVWTWLVSKAITNSLSGLSQMVERTFDVTSLSIKQFPAKDAAMLLGGSENVAVGVYLEIQGDATGHLLLMHNPGTAFKLVDIQLGLPIGSTQQMEEMERSVLGEMGNIAGSFFLNAVADTVNLVLVPSPPEVMVDTVGKIISIPLTRIMEKQDDALIVKATFSADNGQMDGTLMILPTMDFMKAILKHSSTQLAYSQ